MINMSIGEESPLLGHTTASAQLRDAHGVLVLAIQRGEEYIKPTGEIPFELGDIVWIVGGQSAVDKLRQH
jgi:Trk K+ transport system NAD-binding subunit